MFVFSKVQHPIVLRYAVDKNKKVQKHVQIYPGNNKVDDDIWAKVKPRLESRLDKGMIRASGDLSQKLDETELYSILDGPNRGMIRQLCARSKSIDAGYVPGKEGQREFMTLEDLRKAGRS